MCMLGLLAATGKADFRSAEVPFKHSISPTDFSIIPYDFKFELDFHVPNNFGIPGAIIVQNKHPNEFLLASFSLDMPDFPEAQFCTNSWVYNTNNVGRIFFRNQVQDLRMQLDMTELRIHFSFIVIINSSWS